MDEKEIIEYETLSSWWSSWVPFGTGLIASYFVWKARRKYKRYRYLKRLIKGQGVVLPPYHHVVRNELPPEPDVVRPRREGTYSPLNDRTDTPPPPPKSE